MFGNTDIYGLLLFAIALIPSIVLHEIMHAVVAYRLGDDLAHSQGRISLNPLSHVDPFLTIALPIITFLIGSPILAAKPVPINPSRIRGEEYGFALVALAGPLFNIFLAIVAGFAMSFMSSSGVLFDLMRTLLYLNVGLAAFNLLPLPPLDGSRVLFAIAPQPIRSIMLQIEQLGFAGFIVIILLFGQFFSPAVSVIANSILQLISLLTGMELRLY